MDQERVRSFVDTRKAMYMAQTLEAAEEMAITTAGLEASAAADAYRHDRSRRDETDLSRDEITAQRIRRREAFQTHIEPLLPASTVKALRDFKAVVRQRFNALATDAAEAPFLNINGFAQQARDAISPVGRP